MALEGSHAPQGWEQVAQRVAGGSRSPSLYDTKGRTWSTITGGLRGTVPEDNALNRSCKRGQTGSGSRTHQTVGTPGGSEGSGTPVKVRGQPGGAISARTQEMRKVG